MSSKPGQNRRVVSGMRPTGPLHLGNYHGALANWVELQYKYECFFFVADWHALTTGYEDTVDLKANTNEVLIDWLAAGLNPSACTIFVQSRIPEHAELHLILSMVTPISWLERVPTYKDQIEQLKDKDLSTYGFLGYPLLQSADILMYRPEYVPVGEDQVAHVEITREIARRFNHIYGREPDFEVESRSRHETHGHPQRDKVRGAAPEVPGRRGCRGAGPGARLDRFRRPADRRGPRATPRFPRRRRTRDPDGAIGVADQDSQGARARRPQDVEVLWKHDRTARGPGQRRRRSSRP